MSNKKRRHQQQHAARQSQAQQRTAPSSQASLSDALLHAAYAQLVEAIEHANGQAKRTGRPADLSEAGKLLSANPRLSAYLDVAREREIAREHALTRLDMTRTGAPTGSNPQSSAALSGWTGGRNYPIGVPNARVLRDWADSNEWVRAAINARRTQIERADIVVQPLDERKPYNRSVMKALQHLLDQPNELRDSYRSLIGPVIEDILVLDRGVITKNMTPARKPVALYYEDGATIKMYPAWSGNPDEPRYLYEDPASSTKRPLRNDEAIVIIANTASYRYGLSPVQVLRQTIIADLEAMRSGADIVARKPPPHALQMIGASDTQIRNFINYYDAELAGRKQLFVFGGPQKAEHFPLVQSAKENQWLEWQEYLVKKICAIFQISPQQLGLTFDINKATAQSQQSIFEDTGLIPLLLLLEEYLNRELLADFAPRISGDRSNIDALNLRIVFPEVSEAARQMHALQAMDMAAKGLGGLPSMTLNQVLMARGEEPVKGGNTFWVDSKQGPIPWLSYDGDTGDYTPLATGGALGSQDPAGGIDDMADDPGDASADNADAAQNDNGAGAGGQNAGNANNAGGAPTTPSTPTQAPAAAPTGTSAGGGEATKAYRPTLQKGTDDGNDGDAGHTGIMVAFFLDSKTARQLALPDGEPAADLHITLAYLGDRSQYDAAQLTRLKQCVAAYAGQTSPLSGEVSGIGRFTAVPQGAPTPFYASADIPALPAWRQGLVDALMQAGFAVNQQHGYTPHITLAYLDADAPAPLERVPALPLSFDVAWLAIGDDRYAFPCGLQPAAAAAAQKAMTRPMPIATTHRSTLLRDVRRPGTRWSPTHLVSMEPSLPVTPPAPLLSRAAQHPRQSMVTTQQAAHSTQSTQETAVRTQLAQTVRRVFHEAAQHGITQLKEKARHPL